MEKICKKCNLRKPIEQFTIQRDTRDGRRTTCKSCHAQVQRDKRGKDKKLVFDHYGNCQMCGNPDRDVLTIDHTNNDGAVKRKTGEHSKGPRFYAWIITHNYPEGLQSLCWNCQYKKRALLANKKDQEVG